LNSLNDVLGFSVIHSFSLLSLLAIAVPIIIHLINPAKGKLVYIGRIAFLKKTAVSRLLELNIKQWLLLICRILLLFFIALLMAELMLDKPPESVNHPRTYVTQDWVLSASDDELIKLVESNQNAELYWLSNDFSLISNANQHKTEQLISLQQTMKKQSRINPHMFKQDNVLNLIKKLEQQLIVNTSGDAKLVKARLILTDQSNHWPLHKPKFNNQYDWQVKKLVIENSPTVTIDVFTSDSHQVQRDLNLFKHAVSINQNFKLRYFPIKALSTVEEFAEWIVVFDQPNSANEKEFTNKLLHKVNQGHYLLSSWVLAKPLTESLAEPLQKANKLQAIIKSEHILGQGKLFILKQSLSSMPSQVIETERLAIDLLELFTAKAREEQAIRLSESVLSSAVQNHDNVIVTNEKFNQQSLQSWLMILIGFFWLLERILAEYKQPLVTSSFKRQVAIDD
jgi:hypothetical protein